MIRKCLHELTKIEVMLQCMQSEGNMSEELRRHDIFDEA